MVSYVLLHGAASDSWHWHLVAPLLRARGHEVIAPDLPCDDDTAGWSAYVDAVEVAMGDRGPVVLVAQSLAGFIAPMVCQKREVALMVLVAAMVPAPGETGGEWWENTGQPQAARELAEREGLRSDGELDPMVTFLHDVPPDLAAEALRHGKRQSGTPLAEPWPLPGWPDIPTRFLLCRQDRLFPAEFQRRVVAQRLGIVPDELDSGHLPALSRPAELVERLEQYRQQQDLR